MIWRIPCGGIARTPLPHYNYTQASVTSVGCCNSVDVSDIFIFSVRGRGKGSPRRQEGRGGGGFLCKIQEGGGSSGRVGGGEGGWEGVCGEFFLGGGLNIFFRGRNSHQGKDSQVICFMSST